MKIITEDRRSLKTLNITGYNVEIILKYWPVFATIIGGLIWLIRLEGKVQRHDKDIRELESDSKEEIRDINRKLDAMSGELTKMCISFSELSGYIKGKECHDD